MKKRLLAMLLVVVMVCSRLPVSAFAASGTYNGTTYDEFSEQTGTYYVGQKVDALATVTKGNQVPYIQNATYTLSDNKTELGFSGTYLGRGYAVSNGSTYTWSTATNSNGIYGVGFQNMTVTSPGTIDLVVTFQFRWSTSESWQDACFVYHLNFMEAANTEKSSLTLDAGGSESVTSSATFDNKAVSNLTAVSSTSSDTPVASVTVPTVDGDTVNYSITGVSAGEATVTTSYSGTVQVGPSLFGTYSDITVTLTDVINVTVNEASDPEPSKPEAPTDDDFGDLLESGTVIVDCINESASHNNGTYSLEKNGYTVGDATGDAENGYSCDVTVSAEYYLNKYNETNSGHTLASGEDNKIITFTWDDEAESWTTDTISVTFNVTCETEEKEDGNDAPVYVNIYRDGDTTSPVVSINLGDYPLGTLYTDILSNAGYLTGISTIYESNKFATSYEWDGAWGHEVQNIQNGIEGGTVNGWTNLCTMVYDVYPVYYHIDGDTVKTDTITAKALDSYTLYTPDVKEGFTFDGWYEKETDIGNENKKTTTPLGLKKYELYGTYTANTYTVTYDAGEGSVEPVSKQIAYNTTITLPTPTAPEGYTFTGWKLGNSVYEAGSSYLVTGDVTFTAQYERITYTVNYYKVVNGGEPELLESYPNQPYGKVLLGYNGYTAPTGYTLGGWYLDAECTSPITFGEYALTGEDTTVNIYAKVTINTYDITISYNIDSVPDNTTAFANQKYGTEITITSPELDNPPITKTGHTFSGYKSASDGKIYAPGAKYTVIADDTLTAVWTANTYTITYSDGVDGVVFENSVITATYGSATPAYSGTLERTGYVFTGWTPDIAETVTEDATYTATWEKDVLVDPNVEDAPVSGGDGIPDIYQLELTFKVENGNWDDGTNADKTLVVTLCDENGDPSESGTCAITSPAVGSNPSDGYVEGSWTTDLPATVNKDSLTTYTYQYTKNGAISYTIEYYLDDTLASNRTETKTAEFEAQVTVTPMTISGYVFDSAVPSTRTITIQADASQNVVKLYYVTDKWDAENNSPTGGDGIADSKQVLVQYVSSNTRYGTVSPTYQVFTLTDSNTVAISSTATATASGSFVKWTNESGSSVSRSRYLSSDLAVEGGKSYVFTANFVRYESSAESNNDDYGTEGNLSITKTVSGAADEDGTYTFVVTLKDKKTATYSYKVSGSNKTYKLKFTKGVSDELDIKAGTTVTIYDLPSGVKYEVEELDNDEYTVTAKNETGTIPYGSTRKVMFNNDLDEASEAVGTLTNVVPSTPFTDISTNRFKDAIAYVYDAGLMNGVSATTFDPNGTLTRGMIVTVLYRLEGSPDVSGSSVFTDVADGQWYTDAIIWATENGIAKGYGDGTFGPNDPVTREQLAAFFYRYCSTNGYYMGNTFALDGFTDNANVSAYAVTAMEWAVANSVLVSRTTAMLNPTDAATRAEVAQALYILIK